MLELMESIFPTFLTSSFNQIHINDWVRSVEDAKTLSRLHLLLERLDSAIVWDKSAEGAVSIKLGTCQKLARGEGRWKMAGGHHFLSL